MEKQSGQWALLVGAAFFGTSRKSIACLRSWATFRTRSRRIRLKPVDFNRTDADIQLFADFSIRVTLGHEAKNSF